MKFIPSPAMILIALGLLIGSLGAGTYLGMKLERETWQAEKLKLQDAQAKVLEAEYARYARAHKFNEEKARKATETHDKAIADLTAVYVADVAAVKRAGGLRIPAPRCAAAPGHAEAPGPGGPDESATATVRLPTAIEDGLFGIVLDADKLAEQLRALQGWVRSNGFYGETHEPGH